MCLVLEPYVRSAFVVSAFQCSPKTCPYEVGLPVATGSVIIEYMLAQCTILRDDLDCSQKGEPLRIHQV